MKVVAINGSPKMDKGNTALILGPFLVEDGKMSPETLAIVSRELLPLEMWARGTN